MSNSKVRVDAQSYKNVPNFSKGGSAYLPYFTPPPWGGLPCATPIFGCYNRYFSRFTIKKTSKHYRKMKYLSSIPLQQSMGIFAKMPKIGSNSKIREVSVFYKKDAKFSKKFSDKVVQFLPSGGYYIQLYLCMYYNC